MAVCSLCGYKSEHSSSHCGRCGTPITGSPVVDVAESGTLVMPIPKFVPTRQARWESAQLGQDSYLELFIGPGHQMSRVSLTPGVEITLGRNDKDNTRPNEVDLAPHDAHLYGVSRRHAALQLDKDTLLVKDLGSSNGTFLNGRKLVPNEWTLIRNHDELILGKLNITVSFAQ